MTPAEENRVCELTEEIVRLKKHLTENSARMTNADAFDKLEKIGELLSEKNALTGLHEDAAYLYLDDGEWFREVKGFVGDDSGMHDCTGTTLKIGDTVSRTDIPGSSCRICLLKKRSWNAAVKRLRIVRRWIYRMLLAVPLPFPSAPAWKIMKTAYSKAWRCGYERNCCCRAQKDCRLAAH